MNGVADFETMLSRELESFRCGSDAVFLIGVVPVAQQVTKGNSKEMDSSAFLLFQEGDSGDLLRCENDDGGRTSNAPTLAPPTTQYSLSGIDCDSHRIESVIAHDLQSIEITLQNKTKCQNFSSFACICDF
jgi:hypothetical protein